MLTIVLNNLSECAYSHKFDVSYVISKRQFRSLSTETSTKTVIILSVMSNKTSEETKEWLGAQVALK